MRLLVLGASGQTGRRVVEAARDRGWAVRAVARQVTAAFEPSAGVELRDLDLLNVEPHRIRELLAGCDAVVSTLGVGSGRGPTTLYSSAVAATLRAVPDVRIAVVSAVPVGGAEGHALLERRLAIPLLRRIFAGTYEDMGSMERLLASSAARWTVLRPPRLRDADVSGKLVCSRKPIAGGRSVTTGDLALALLDAVSESASTGAVVYVATKGRVSS